MLRCPNPNIADLILKFLLYYGPAHSGLTERNTSSIDPHTLYDRVYILEYQTFISP